MRKFIKRHQKKFLAFCMIVLMISFAASSGNRANGRRNDVVIGQIEGKAVYSSESQQAHVEWGLLNRSVLIPAKNPYTQEIEEVPIAVKMFPAELLRSDKAPDLFMLLRHEAREAGIQPNNDEVQNIFTTYYHRPPGTDEAMDDTAHDAITDFLLIEANFNRLASDVKISQPQRDHLLAEAAQAIQLNVVELTQSDYLSKARTPTTQQIQEQFAKYANVVPGQPDEQNPFGFGYRLPDGVKLQYLSINMDDARKAVEATQTAYDWDVKARLYYLQHKDEFSTTQPADSAIGPTSQPSALPYSQVALEALEKLREPLVTKLMFDVQGKIVSTMEADWRSYSQNPSSSADYPSYAYLQKIAGQIQTQFGMKVEATEMARDFLSQEQLDRLPEIGHTSNGRTDFAPYVLQLAGTYFARSDKGSPTALANLMQPAAPLKDIDGNLYIFRLTDARPAQPAPSLADMSLKVNADLRNQAAYQLARAAADPLLIATRNGSLLPAASAMGKIIWMTPPFTKPLGNGRANLGKDIVLSPAGEKKFVQQAFELLSQFNPETNPHPALLIEIPADGKVYVAELLHLTPHWDQGSFFSYSLQAARQLHEEQLIKIRSGWMQYDAAVQRLGFKPENSQKDSSS
jgi:hypothetical protein